MDYVTFISRYFPTGVDAHLYRKRLAPPGSPGKVQARVVKRMGMPTPEFLHACGQPGSMEDIGFYPFLGDGTLVQFGLIDIDNYEAGHTRESLQARLDVFGLPLSIIPSKSVGGFQLMMTFSEPIRARDIRLALKKMAVWLGLDPNFKGSKTEILPKQGKILISDGDVGTGLMLPKAAQQAEVIANTRTVDEWNAILDEGEFADGASCLFPLFLGSPGEYRNNILYQYCIFARLKYPFDWKERARAKNEKAFQEPLTEREVTSMIKGLDKNDGGYICTAAPFESVCNREACKAKKYGVSANSPVLSRVDTDTVSILMSDPPTFFISMSDASGEEHRMSLTTDQLFHVSKFAKRCLETVFEVPELPKQKQWEASITEMLQSAARVEVPAEMSEAARIYDQIIAFLRTATITGDQGQLISNKVYVCGEAEMLAYFRLADFHGWLERNRAGRLSMNDLSVAIYKYAYDGRLPVQIVKLQPINIEVYQVAITDHNVRDHIEGFFLKHEKGLSPEALERKGRRKTT